MKTVLTVILLALASTSTSDILLTIEDPTEYSIKQGVGNIRGWVVSDSPVIGVRHYLNGVDMGAIPYGGERLDIGLAYPGYPDSDRSGFSRSMYWGHLDDDNDNELTVIALNEDGEFAEQTVMFNVARLKNRKEWEKSPNLQFMSFVALKDGFALEDVIIGNNVIKTITFEWSNKLQGFAIVEIVQ